MQHVQLYALTVLQQNDVETSPKFIGVEHARYIIHKATSRAKAWMHNALVSTSKVVVKFHCITD